MRNYTFINRIRVKKNNKKKYGKDPKLTDKTLKKFKIIRIIAQFWNKVFGIVVKKLLQKINISFQSLEFCSF